MEVFARVEDVLVDLDSAVTRLLFNSDFFVHVQYLLIVWHHWDLHGLGNGEELFASQHALAVFTNRHGFVNRNDLSLQVVLEPEKQLSSRDCTRHRWSQMLRYN